MKHASTFVLSIFALSFYALGGGVASATCPSSPEKWDSASCDPFGTGDICSYSGATWTCDVGDSVADAQVTTVTQALGLASWGSMTLDVGGTDVRELFCCVTTENVTGNGSAPTVLSRGSTRGGDSA